MLKKVGNMSLWFELISELAIPAHGLGVSDNKAKQKSAFSEKSYL
jgi:hypothetical protein